MSEISAINSALAGIQKGLSGVHKNAADIASAGASQQGLSTESLARSVVNLKENELQVQGSIKVLKAVDEMIGTLFDEEA